MLDDLVSVIETLQQRIATHRQSLQQNETRTRTALIDPLLTALGWDVSDPAMVTPEYNVSGKRADYALLGGNGPTVFLEAKKLDEPLGNHRSQIVAYASELGIKFPALTNGNEWEVYDNSKLVPIDQRRILNLSISNTPSHESALQLLLLWRPNVASEQPTAASEPIFDAETATDPETTQVDNHSANLSGWVTLSEYNLPGGASHPAAIRFHDGTEKPINQWYETLTHTAEWLFVNGRLNSDNTPVVNGPGHRYIISTGTVHPTGEAFAKPVRVNGTPFWVNINLNAAQVRRYASVLLEHCGMDPDTVHLQVGL